MASLYSALLEHAAMPAVAGLTKSRFWPCYRQMLDLEHADRAQLQRLQWQRFKQLLEHAAAKVPFHRERLAEAGISPADIASPDDLHRLPITTKAQIQRHFPDRVTAEDSDRDDWQYVSTRGTADRLMAIHDFAKRDMVRAAAVRAARLSGNYRLGQVTAEIPPNICNIVCGDEGQTIEGVLPHVWGMIRQGKLRDGKSISDLRGLIERNWIFRRRTYPPFGMQGTALPDDKLQRYVELIQRDRPRILKALPTYLMQIARYALRTGSAPLPVAVVKPMGSSVSPRMKDVIERGFAGEYREDYGSAECGDMACDCPQHQGLHIFMDLFLIEVVRDGNKPAPDRQLGKILITDLSNQAMPLIRYEIGDVGRLDRSLCDCGRASPRLLVEGRLQDTIVNEDGRAITNDMVMDHFYDQPQVEDFQVVETRPGRFDVMVVPSPQHTLNPESLARGFEAFIGGGAAAKLFVVKTIRPEESGKFRFVKSCTYQRLDQMPAPPVSSAHA